MIWGVVALARSEWVRGWLDAWSGFKIHERDEVNAIRKHTWMLSSVD